MILFRLSLRNIISTGLRTWLNTFVLSLTFVCIVLLQGLNDGLYHQMTQTRIDDELGSAQFWHQNYDPFDPLTLESSHARIPISLQEIIHEKLIAPILIIPGVIYPQGRIQYIILKGIAPEQEILKLPTAEMNQPITNDAIPVMIGRRMAKHARLELGDLVTARWRNSDGAFDALELTLVKIFRTDVPAVDQGQIWLPLNRLQEMYQAPDHATLLVMGHGKIPQNIISPWRFRSMEDLLIDTRQLLQAKSIGSSFFYGLLLFLALIAIFDTQALSLFRRQKEVGTLMAMGMTQRQVVGIFMLEGIWQGLLAALLALFIGGPIGWYLAVEGYSIPVSADQYGLAISSHLYAYFSLKLVLGTFLVVMIMLSVVSYWPARKIADLMPAEALRGRWT